MRNSTAPIANKIGAFLMPLSLIGGVSLAIGSNETSPAIPVPDCKGDVSALGFCDHFQRSVTGAHLMFMWVGILLAIVGTIYGIYLFFKGRDWL